MRIVMYAHEQHHRSEYLFVGDLHLGRHVRQDGGLEIVAFVAQRALATGNDTRALRDRPVDRLLDDLELKRCDDGADVDDSVAAVALPKRPNQVRGASFEGIVDAVVDENSLRGDTVLPAIDVATGQ